MTCWIIEKSQGFTDVGLLRISESIRAYAYLILSSQASARSGLIGNTASALTAQKVFFNNLENVVNWRVDIREDIKQYQETLIYTLSKVDYRVRENIYMLPGDMNQNIRLGTAGYGNKILVSDGTFSLGKNDKVNTLKLVVSTPKLSHKESRPTITPKNLAQKQINTQTITHKEEKLP